jgi:plasmid stability protein
MAKVREGKTRIVIVVSEKLKSELRVRAIKEGRSLSGLVNYILESEVKKNAGKV